MSVSIQMSFKIEGTRQVQEAMVLLTVFDQNNTTKERYAPLRSEVRSLASEVAGTVHDPHHPDFSDRRDRCRAINT